MCYSCPILNNSSQNLEECMHYKIKFLHYDLNISWSFLVELKEEFTLKFLITYLIWSDQDRVASTKIPRTCSRWLSLIYWLLMKILKGSLHMTESLCFEHKHIVFVLDTLINILFSSHQWEIFSNTVFSVWLYNFCFYQ